MTTSRRIASVFFCVGLVSSQSGCSWVKSWFPDKEKEYKYSTEIPPLDVPPDLSSSTIEEFAVEPVASAERPVFSAGGPDAVDVKADRHSPVAEQETQEQLVRKIGPGTLEINQPFPRAWRLVEKALTRKAIEVTDRDRSRGLYYVLYQETDEAAAQEGTLWGEVLFFFGGGSEREAEYRVLLEEDGEVTKVSILDNDGAHLKQGPGVRLLNLIKEALEVEEGQEPKP